MNLSRRYFFQGLVFCIIAIALCIAASIFYTNQIDSKQRAELLKQAQYASLLVSEKDIASLSASEADLENPVYILMKEELTKFRSFNENIRFVYVMGYQPEIKTQFFYVDSEPETSEDYSPPGQLFPDTRPEDISRYLAGEPYTDGPYSDSWGEWVSGSVPLRDAQGSVYAMIGIDIATTVWFEEIIFVRTVFTIIALLLCLIIYFITHRFSKKEQSIHSLATKNIKLQQNEAKLEEIQKLAQLGKIVFYFSDQSVVLDSQFQSLYRERGQKMAISEFIKFIHPDDHSIIESSLEEMQKTDMKYAWFDVRVGSHELGFRKYHFYGNVEHDTAGSTNRFSGIMQDITDIA